MYQEFDVIVAGAGMVGASIAYGLVGLNRRVLMLDGEDTDYRAAKANFGLVWAQGKGFGHPDYQRLSTKAVKDWAGFAAQLQGESDIDIAYENRGGLNYCLGEEDFLKRSRYIAAWHSQAPELAPATRMIDRNEIVKLFPKAKLGKDVVGASFGVTDGHANPLKLLAALQKAFLRRGGVLLNNHKVTAIRKIHGGGYEVQCGEFRARSERVVIAAGLGSAALCPMVGLSVPINPQRGQLLVTERLPPLLPLPASGLRQTAEGTVMIGVTQEDVGFDLATTAEGAAKMIRKAIRIFPDLAQAKLVRQWSCLRVMTPDGNPVYAGSVTHPGVYIATCHSGVTLASFHANEYARAIAGGVLPTSLEVFHHGRFDVQKTA